jgi:hypothetical protein
LYWQRILIARLPYIAALIAVFIGHILIKAAFIVVWSTFSICGSPGKVVQAPKKRFNGGFISAAGNLVGVPGDKRGILALFSIFRALWPQKVLNAEGFMLVQKTMGSLRFFLTIYRK